MTATRRPNTRRSERLFHIAITVKGIDGGLQLVGALLLIMVPATVITGISNTVVTRDLLGDPNGTLATHLRTSASHFADSGTRAFAIAYLLLHALVKLGLVVALVRKLLTAFPVAIVILTALLGYEVWRAAHTGSLALSVFAAVDAAIVILVTREYIRLLRDRGEQSPPACH